MSQRDRRILVEFINEIRSEFWRFTRNIPPPDIFGIRDRLIRKMMPPIDQLFLRIPEPVRKYTLQEVIDTIKKAIGSSEIEYP